jgi:hypothetical protein
MEIPKDKRFKDLTNLKFGRLTVLSYEGKRNRIGPSHQWLCRCDCGAQKLILGNCLKTGNTTSCGCAQKEIVHKQQFKDLTGKRFEKLIVLSYAGKSRPHDSKQPGHQWLCRCDCGVEKIIGGNVLKQETTLSCGCLHKTIVSDLKRIDLKDKKYGRLTVVRFVGEKDDNYFWLCRCECGKEKEINGVSLRKGRSKSCGCRQGNFIHGMTGKPGYKRFYLSDPVRKIRHNVGGAVRGALKRMGSSKKGESTFNYLPYTPLELKDHLEKQFEPWMTWDNYGDRANSTRKTWQIDHIIAQVYFPYSSLDDPLFQECWALSNLRPLEKLENMKKGAK